MNEICLIIYYKTIILAIAKGCHGMLFSFHLFTGYYAFFAAFGITTILVCCLKRTKKSFRSCNIFVIEDHELMLESYASLIFLSFMK